MNLTIMFHKGMSMMLGPTLLGDYESPVGDIFKKLGIRYHMLMTHPGVFVLPYR